ncbi:unnamed protein product [Haemonchus placei]|uniref:MICOS complex subunit MIC10 n=1 Tax=Haemonchus placei TaxID=6290 RepID=A0A0N4WSJ0_HAEPC|nr:unnamed protein product [Haemonchus placei]
MLAFASGIIAGAVLYHYCTKKEVQTLQLSLNLLICTLQEVSEHSPEKQSAPPTRNVKNANCHQDVPAQPVMFNCQTARSVSMATSKHPSSAIRTANLASAIRMAERRQSSPCAVMPSSVPAPAGGIPQLELVSLPEEMVATAELPEPEILTAIQ